MKMLMKLSLVLVFTLSLVCLPMYSQSKENGAIEGRVYSEEQPLPGVGITVSSPKLIGGTRVTVSNAEGRYRFVALPYGIYSIEVKMDGFTTVKKTDIKVTVGKTLSVDFSMTLGKITETIEVRGSALIDVKDSQTAVATISKELIENMPNSQTVSQIVNLAPGVTQDSAFGAHDYGVQYQIDGVDVSDPGLGSAWVFLDYGTVEEAQIMGIGAPAEYGGFTGIVFNTVTKTGSNKFKGMVDVWMQLNKWNADNSGDTGVSPPGQGFYNANINLGGPFLKDKLWFFASGQYKQRIRDITGFPEQSVYDMPRVFFKLTWQPNENNRFNGFVHWELYEGTNRWADAFTDVEAAATQDGPGVAFNASYLHIFGDRTFFEAKFAGFKGFYKLRPKESYDIPGYYDMHSQRWAVNCSVYMHFYRAHYQLNSSLSHHADDFIAGSHDFKFGIEAEYNPSTEEYGYSGNRFYYTYYYGYNYYMFEYEGYSTPSKSMRISAYVQDSWEVSDRLKINAGLRLNYYRGKLDAPIGTIFKPKTAIAPRIGITFDLFGDHTTALKAHYGKYYENIVSAKYIGLSEKPDHDAYMWGPAYNWWYGTNYGEEWVYYYSWNNGADTTSMDENLSMPYMHQYTIGLERELLKDLSVGVNLIHRVSGNFIDSVLINGTFEPFTFTEEETGREYTLYRQTNDPSENLYIITNVHKDKYPIISFEPERKYTGIEFLLNKKFSNNWTLLASYVYSKSTGNVDNLWSGRGSNTGQSSMFTDPNNLINAEGRLSIDPTHMVKIQGSLILPLDITVGFNFLYQTGNTYNRRIYIDNLLASGQGANASRLLADEAGSVYRFDPVTRLDLRIQKDFKFGNFRVGLLADIFNVFNAGTITDVNDTAEQFGEVSGIMYPRRFRLGVKLYF